MDVCLLWVLCVVRQRSGWSLVQRRPTEYYVSGCDREAWTIRKPWWKKNSTILIFFWRDWGKLLKTSTRVTEVPTEIWTAHVFRIYPPPPCFILSMGYIMFSDERLLLQIGVNEWYKNILPCLRNTLKAGVKGVNTGGFKKMDSILYIYISWTIHGMRLIYITFERGSPKFSNTTARALVYRSPSSQPCSSLSWEQNGY